MKIQCQKHHYISEHGCGHNHDYNDVKRGSIAEGGARILIKESSIKAIELC